MFSKRVLATLLLAAGVAGSGVAFAAGPSDDRVPTYVEVLSDGSVIIEASPEWNNPDLCRNPNRVIIPNTNQFINMYYAAVLTAYSTKGYIWAWLDGCQEMGWGENYPVAQNVATRARP